ncbi:MAG: M28 family peptidase [Proteobacteria bacterium]|nr:M28 family peptidase [Pseudomonadota bacterium]
MKNRKTFFIKLFLLSGLILISFLFLSYWYMVKCNSKWNGIPLEKQMNADLSKIKKELESDVYYMSVEIGPRNIFSYERLQKCAEWIKKKWESQRYTVKSHKFSIQGKEFENLEIEIKGQKSPSEIVIISAQYDTLPDSPGANNNAAGVAVLLQLSKLLKNHTPDRTIRLVNFVNEEDSFFGTEWMGSFLYAKRAYQNNENIKVMLSLDAIGFYKEESGSQKLSFPFSLFYPDRGNFLAFIGDLNSRNNYD